MPKVDLEKLLETGAHFGHQTKRWNPSMAPYLYGVKDGVRVFDLIKTKKALEEALDELKKASLTGKVILFVGTKKQVKDKVREVAKELNLPYVDHRWLGGTLTNRDQIGKSIRSLKEMKEKMESGEYKTHTKKERLLIQRKIEKLETNLGGVSEMDKPDVMFVVDTHRERGAVLEARKKGVEVIGITDSNADPDLVDFPIPMNDDATRATDYVLELVKEAILEGRKKPAKKKIVKKAKKTVKSKK